MEQLTAASFGVALAVAPIHGELALADLIDLPPTPELEAARSALEGALGRLDEAARRREAHRLARAQVRADQGRRRDRLAAAERARGPDYADCWCLGLGGQGELALRVADGAGGYSTLQEADPQVAGYRRYCGCPSGRAALERAEAALAEMRALVARRAVARLHEAARIPARYAGLTLESWREAARDAGADPEHVRAVRDGLVAFRDALGTPRPRDLVLAGGYGTGKTGLAAALAREGLDAGRTVVFRTVAELLAELRAAPFVLRARYGAEAEVPPLTELEVLRAARAADLLVLDDLGAEAITATNEQRVLEALFLVVDHRVAELRPTIYTTNLARSELEERVGPRLVAKLDDAVRVVMRTPNLRGDW